MKNLELAEYEAETAAILADAKSACRHWRAAEAILYDWACSNTQTADAKSACHQLGFEIDFRQADAGAFFDAYHIESGEYVRLDV